MILIQFAPSFHGLYRAIISTPFRWTLEEWTKLTEHVNRLFTSEIVERLNSLLGDALDVSENDPEEAQFIQVFLSRYILRERPLTGYFIVCCVIEVLWTVLVQAMSPDIMLAPTTTSDSFAEAAAANEAWKALMRRSVQSLNISDAAREAMQSTYTYATRCFTDLLVEIERMDSEPSLSTYAWETMSESLVCSTFVNCLYS